MSIFAGKTLMITGGTGSFGNAVLNRFLATDIREIRVFSRDEKKQDDMRHEFQAKMPEAAAKIKFFIGDVRDPASVRGAMHGVDYIFHAAALKQVPSCEFFPMEAVRTNIIGTDNVITAAVENKVERVVFLSTDKAAYPINSMGMTKAVAEKVVQAQIPAMVVTLGGDGAVYADVNGVKGHCPAIDVQVKDTTGAGDAFCAGVAIGLTYGKTLHEAIEIGSQLAASVITSSENVCPRFLPKELGIDIDAEH